MRRWKERAAPEIVGIREKVVLLEVKKAVDSF
jgi:hypothetical protein